MPKATNQQKNWAFTSFDVDPPAYLSSIMRYLIYGVEICPTTGRQHYQCYTQLHKKVRFSTFKALIDSDAHIEACRGSPNENIAYCKKDKQFTEHGETPLNPGARTDLEAVVTRLSEGEDLDSLLVDPACMDIIARHMQYFQRVATNYRNTSGLADLRSRMASAVLKSWQQDLLIILNAPADDRKVYWYFDLAGSTGKSFMADYCVACHEAVIFTHGKVQDIAHAYNFEPIVIFDLSRTQADKIDSVYMAIENFKNGRFFSSKYQSVTKIFKKPHVVVFSNFYPEQGKLSIDRWVITEL